MPQAVGAAILAVIGASSVGTVAILGTTVASLLGTAVLIGGGLAVQSLLAPKPDSPTRGADAQAVFNQSISPRIRVYGRAMVGGTRAFWDSRDARLFQIVMIASHRIDAFEGIWIGDVLATVDETGRVLDAPFVAGASSYAYLHTTPGYASQTASAGLVSAFPGIWTSAHQLNGIAYLLSIFSAPQSEDYLGMWPQGAQTTLRSVVRGAKVYDPRDVGHTSEDNWVDPSTWEWSDNPALCIMDYLRCPDGMNKPLSRIDVASFTAFANLCDQAVALKAGGTEKRYRLGGTVTLNEDPVDALRRMLATCDGELYTTSAGKIAIRGGQWVVPDVAIGAANILAVNDMAEGADAFAAFNELSVIYTSPLHDYQPTEAESWVNAAVQAARGRIVEDLSLDMVQSPSQARRLAKIYMSKQNPEFQGSVVTDLSGMNVLGEDSITLELPELLIDGPFRTTGFSLRADLTGCDIGVSSISSAAYDWNPAAEEGTPPANPQITAPDLSLTTPTGLALSIENRFISGFSTADVVVAEVTPPSNGGLSLYTQIRHDTGDWISMTNSTSDQWQTYATFAVVSGTVYYVRARFTAYGASGPWSAEVPITAP